MLILNYITPVMYSDSTGEFAISLTVGIVTAFIVAGGVSALSQGLTYGWDNISLAQVGVDATLGAASVAIAATGIGLVGSIVIGASFGMGQYSITSYLHDEEITVQGLMISGVLGGVSGAISGAGARNSKLINSKLTESGVGRRGLRAITTAFNRYSAGEITEKGLIGTINLYTKVTANAIQGAVPGIISKEFTRSTVRIIGSTVSVPLVTSLLNRIDYR